MHPEIARKLTAQRGRELREQAQQAMVAKTVSRRRRAAKFVFLSFLTAIVRGVAT